MNFSLIVPVYNREAHLVNLLKGVWDSSVLPSEILIVNMGAPMQLSGFKQLPIRVILLEQDGESPLPIAKARNRGAAEAVEEILFFLDVDCIPSEDYFEHMLRYAEVNKGLIMGTPKYLSKPIKNNFTERNLKNLAIAHPYRPVVDGCEIWSDAGLFWSLCFTIRKSLFKRIQGFDEGYKGYGAEDTDLAFMLLKKGYYFFIADAVVYHQQHPVYSPPFQNFDEIIANCTYFYKKWNTWAMGQWLQRFEDKGLIEWSPNSKEIKIRKSPSKQLIDSAFKKKAAYM